MCKRYRIFIKTLVGRKISVLSEKEYYHVHNEYGEIINASEISKGDDAIADVWDEYNTEQFPDTKRGKYQNILLTGNDIKLSMSKNISKNLKENFQNHKRKYNVSLTFYHENIYLKIEDFLVDNKQKYFDQYNESEVEVLSKPSAYVQSKNLESILNSMNVFLL